MAAPGWWNPYREYRQATFWPSLLSPLTLVTPPSGQIVTLAQACRQCRIPEGFDDDMINDLIADATEVVERNIYGEAQMLTATYSVQVRHWWWFWTELKLPRPPLQSVVSITYVDPNGDTQTLGPSIYEVQAPWRQPGSVRRVPYQVFPALRLQEMWPITITFQAGYGTIDAVPRCVKRAALTWIASAYRNRGDTEVDERTWNAVQALLDQAGYGSYA